LVYFSERLQAAEVRFIRSGSAREQLNVCSLNESNTVTNGFIMYTEDHFTQLSYTDSVGEEVEDDPKRGKKVGIRRYTKG
jgi:hypothetical protein